ncbi:MAG: hypothetical protein WDW38_000343 [Sanguina aurantia]
MMCELTCASQALSPVLSASLLPRLLTSPSAAGRTHGLELLHALLQSPALRLSLHRPLLTPDLGSHSHPAIPAQVQRPVRHVAAPAGAAGKRGGAAVAAAAPEVIDLSAAAEDDVCVVTRAPGSSRAEQGGVRFGGGAAAAAAAAAGGGRSRRQSAAPGADLPVPNAARSLSVVSSGEAGVRPAVVTPEGQSALSLSHTTAVDHLAGILEALSFQQDPDVDPDESPECVGDNPSSATAHGGPGLLGFPGLHPDTAFERSGVDGGTAGMHSSGSGGSSGGHDVLYRDALDSQAGGGSRTHDGGVCERWAPFKLRRQALALVALLLEAREHTLLRLLAGCKPCGGEEGGGGAGSVAVRGADGDSDGGRGRDWPPYQMGLTQRLLGLLDEAVSISDRSMLPQQRWLFAWQVVTHWSPATPFRASATELWQQPPRSHASCAPPACSAAAARVLALALARASEWQFHAWLISTGPDPGEGTCALIMDLITDLIMDLIMDLILDLIMDLIMDLITDLIMDLITDLVMDLITDLVMDLITDLVSLPEWHQRVRLAQETLLLTKELMLAEQGTRTAILDDLVTTPEAQSHTSTVIAKALEWRLPAELQPSPSGLLQLAPWVQRFAPAPPPGSAAAAHKSKEASFVTGATAGGGGGGGSGKRASASYSSMDTVMVLVASVRRRFIQHLAQHYSDQ